MIVPKEKAHVKVNCIKNRHVHFIYAVNRRIVNLGSTKTEEVSVPSAGKVFEPENYCTSCTY